MGCEYFADGGDIQPMPVPQPQIHPSVALGHAALSHGLLGLLKNVGRPNMANPEKSHKTLDKAKAHLNERDHEKAAEAMHESPLAGQAGKENLKKIVGHLAPAIMNNEPDPEALRGSIDYMNSAVRGHDSLENQFGGAITKDKMSIDPDNEGVDKLKDFLQSVKEKPEQLLDIGGKLGHYMPDHAAGLGAMAATGTQYLNSIKPMSSQGAPLDDVTPPDKGQMAAWNRHLDIAQKPQRILQHIKNGTLLPQDLLTLKTIYPGLHQSMVEKAGEALIDAKTKKKEIPYKQRASLSLLLGQPLDSTMTPQSMQAIIRSAGIQQAQVRQEQAENKKKATGVELKQINKVNEMYETPSQQRQLDRR